MIAALIALLDAYTPGPGRPIVLPTRCEANRFFAEPITADGKKLNLYTDSAGGLFLTEASAKSLGLIVKKGLPNKVALPDFRAGLGIPAPLTRDGLLNCLTLKEMPLGEEWTGMLGQEWFGGRIWRWDYGAKTLSLIAREDIPTDPEHSMKLAFKPGFNFARMQMVVDSESIDMLFDTGACDLWPEEVLKESGESASHRASSFLAQSIYERWHAKHPEWKVIERQTTTGRVLIRVPAISIAGNVVGPVWFGVQQDSAFQKYMAQWMDKPTWGALGGSAFKYFRIFVDYPRQTVVFQKL